MKSYVYDVESKQISLRSKYFLQNVRYGCPLEKEVWMFKLDVLDINLAKNDFGKEETAWNNAEGNTYAYRIAESIN
mgnify:CR=1 FL=1